MAHLQVAPGERFVDLWPNGRPQEDLSIRVATPQRGNYILDLVPVSKTPRMVKFFVQGGALGDKVLSALKAGPKIVNPGDVPGEYVLELDWPMDERRAATRKDIDQ